MGWLWGNYMFCDGASRLGEGGIAAWWVFPRVPVQSERPIGRNPYKGGHLIPYSTVAVMSTLIHHQEKMTSLGGGLWAGKVWYDCTQTVTNEVQRL